MKIAKEVIKNTTNCPANFACLNDSQHCLCKVKECLNEKIYFLECSDNKPCDYKISFGNSHTCNCPTRKEIYNQYKI